MYNLERYRSQRCKTRLYTIPSFYDNCSFLTSIYLYLFKIFQFFFFFKSISINYLRSKYSTNTEYRREKKKYFIGSRKKNDTLIILLSLILKKIIILDEGQRRGDAVRERDILKLLFIISNWRNSQFYLYFKFNLFENEEILLYFRFIFLYKILLGNSSLVGI